MKKSMTKAMALLISMAFLLSAISCATMETPRKTGFLGEYYNKLEQGPKEGVKWRWMKPGVNYAKYDKVMIDSVIFYFSPESEDKGIDPVVMKDLADEFNQELVNAVKDKYPIVSEPGPDVMRLKFALTGIRQSRPVLAGATTVIPVGVAASVVKKATTDEWIGSGATEMEVMLIDTATNEVVAAGQDQQLAGFTERFSKYGSAKIAFKYWAHRLRLMMDYVHTTARPE